MAKKNEIKELRKTTGLSQSRFAEKYMIPLRTLQGWELGRNVPETVGYMLKKLVMLDGLEVSAYVLADYNDRGGRGSEQVLTGMSKNEAIAYGEKEWDHMSYNDQHKYRAEDGDYFAVMKAPLHWDDYDEEWLPDTEAAEVVWSAF